MAKIAIGHSDPRDVVARALEHSTRMGLRGRTDAKVIATGDGWSVADVVCTCGPADRPFEEAHERFAIALVASGTFQYRSAAGRVLMTPGSLMIGTPQQCFECGHEHATGDRCVSFWFDPVYFERLAADAGWRGPLQFATARVPPIRALSGVSARITSGLAAANGAPWEEIGVALAGAVVQWSMDGRSSTPSAGRRAEARITEAVRAIERGSAHEMPLRTLARECGLTPFHFLRTFEGLTGLTPHQYVKRVRLRSAAVQLARGNEKVLDVALDSGFGDVSNFNRAFRGEFGATPREWRRAFTRA